MSSNPPAPPAPAPPKGKLTWLEAASDIPQAEALISAIVAAAAAEKGAKSWADRVKVMEPVLEQAAALGDILAAQIASP